MNFDEQMKAIVDADFNPETKEEEDKRLKMVEHFRDHVKKETEKLNKFSDTWNNLVVEAPDDGKTPKILIHNLKCFLFCLWIAVKGDIRSAIGLAKLLINERFDQFMELIDQCEHLKGEKAVLWTDLEGFWEMIHIQVSLDSGSAIIFLFSRPMHHNTLS